MARKTRHHIGVNDAPTPSIFRPKHLTKQEFGRRLYTLMNSKGWHQSELARRANLNRDAISTYIRGKTLPTPANAKALADALGVDKEELLPNHIESAIDDDTPAFEMKVSTNAPNMAWLRVNRLVSTATAVKIAELLQNDDALNRSRSGGPAAMQQDEGETPETDGPDDLFEGAARIGRGR
jgi:transcriptional regulator with XRE-family HTH domain